MRVGGRGVDNLEVVQAILMQHDLVGVVDEELRQHDQVPMIVAEVEAGVLAGGGV